jgi:ABC-type thiamine transport system substrate-binding protein
VCIYYLNFYKKENNKLYYIDPQANTNGKNMIYNDITSYSDNMFFTYLQKIYNNAFTYMDIILS